MVVQLRAVFCPSVQCLSFFCKSFSWTILDSGSFPLIHGGQVFHESVCHLTVVLPHIFFSRTTLFSYLVFFCLFLCTSWCCCSPPCISQILQVQIFSFSVLSFCLIDQKFLHAWPDFSKAPLTIMACSIPLFEYLCCKVFWCHENSPYMTWLNHLVVLLMECESLSSH